MRQLNRNPPESDWSDFPWNGFYSEGRHGHFAAFFREGTQTTLDKTVPPGMSMSGGLCHRIFIRFYEVAHAYRERIVVIGSKWIDPQNIFKPGDYHCETQRVESGFKKRETINQRRQAPILLLGDLDKLSYYLGFD